MEFHILLSGGMSGVKYFGVILSNFKPCFDHFRSNIGSNWKN